MIDCLMTEASDNIAEPTVVAGEEEEEAAEKGDVTVAIVDTNSAFEVEHIVEPTVDEADDEFDEAAIQPAVSQPLPRRESTASGNGTDDASRLSASHSQTSLIIDSTLAAADVYPSESPHVDHSTGNQPRDRSFRHLAGTGHYFIFFHLYLCVISCFFLWF